MKIGAENKRKVAIMVVLLAIAIPLVFSNLKGVLWGGTDTPRTSAASPVDPRTTAARKGAIQDDPSLRTDILDASRSVKYEPGNRNPFAYAVAIPTPHPGVRQGTPTPTPIPTPTPLPPIPLKFYGFSNRPGEQRKIFLAEGERIFVAGQNDIVDRRYKVVQIQPNSVLIEDMLNNNRQPIPLTPR